jgi:hypothetical protein
LQFSAFGAWADSSSEPSQEARALFVINAAQIAAELVQRTSILAAAAPDNVISRAALWQIRQLRRLLAVIEELLHRNFQCPGHFLERFNSRYGVSVFHARDVATKQARPLLNVPLRKLLRIPQLSQPVADNHPESTSGILPSWFSE